MRIHSWYRWLAGLCLAGLAATGAGVGNRAGEHLLFDFDAGIGGWRTNVYGSGTLKLQAEREHGIRGGTLHIVSRGLHGGNVISPPLPAGEPWRLRRYDRVRFWVKAAAPMTRGKLVFVTDEKNEPTYVLSFIMETTAWTEHVYPLTRCWNRAGQHLDASRLRAVYVNPAQPDAAFSIDDISLLEAARVVALQPERVLPLGAPFASAPRLDGKLGDACWQNAVALGDFVRYGDGRPARDQTEVFLGYDDRFLYLGARLHSSAMDKLKATETARDAPVWQDDCIEVFIDPEHTHRQWRQFVVNSRASLYDALLPGGKPGTGTAWNCDWQAACGRESDAWTVELRIPLEAIGGLPGARPAMGFNVCREAPSTGELSMWNDTGGRFTRVWGFADLVPVAGNKLEAPEELALEEKTPGDYVLRFSLPQAIARTAALTVRVQAPGEVDLTLPVTAEQEIAPGRFAVPIAFPAKEDGLGRVIVAAVAPGPSKRTRAYGAYTFHITLPREADLKRLVLVPEPREMTADEGFFLFDAKTRTFIGRGQRDGFTGAVIADEIGRNYGVHPSVRGHGEMPARNRLLLGCPGESPRVAKELRRLGLNGAYERLGPEGYVRSVRPEGVLIAGRDARGTYYGARTLLQLVSHATAEGMAPRAPCCRIVDWPEYAVRAYMIFTTGWPQDPLDPEVLKEFIYKQVAGFKYNTLVWQVKAGYRYSRWPRLANRCAMTREQIRDVARFARDHFLEIIPETNVLGHANWIVLKYPELKEDGKPHQLCTRHPMTDPMLFDIFDEMLEVFDFPKRLHVGLDEVRWKTFNLPENERCPRCRGIPKWKIYADHVTALHDYLKKRHVEMWMWGDMLLPTHNGGPPFDCAKALPLIPKDIVICNWSAEHSRGSCRMFSEAGFRVVKANSRQIPPEDAPYVLGNLASFWYRHPWCPMSQVGERGLMLTTAYAAEYSWRTNREHISQNAYARQTDCNVLRLLARPPLSHAGAECTPVSIEKVANRALRDAKAGDGKGWFDFGPGRDLRFAPKGDCRIGNATFRLPAEKALVLDAAGSGSALVPVKRAVGSILLLHTVGFPEEKAKRKAWLKAFLAPNEGVAAVLLRVRYADGKTIEIPLRIGMEVGSWLPRNNGEYLVRCPYLLRVPTAECREQAPGTADSVLYVFEWENPRPKIRVDALEFRDLGGGAPYALLGVSVRSVR